MEELLSFLSFKWNQKAGNYAFDETEDSERIIRFSGGKGQSFPAIPAFPEGENPREKKKAINNNSLEAMAGRAGGDGGKRG